jgi:hypothetical protein
MPRAIGNQGNWFARVDAPRYPEIHKKNLPCVWDYWWSPPNEYCDRGYKPEKPNFAKLVEGLRSEGFAILRRRRKNSDLWEADGYIAVYEISDVRTDDHLTFKFVRRVCNLD